MVLRAVLSSEVTHPVPFLLHPLPDTYSFKYNREYIKLMILQSVITYNYILKVVDAWVE